MIQENYIQRNILFQSCRDRLKQFQKVYDDIETDTQRQFDEFKTQIVTKVAAVCDSAAEGHDEEISRLRQTLQDATAWDGSLRRALGDAEAAIAAKQRFFDDALRESKRQFAENMINVDLDFFEQNERNREALAGLDRQVGELVSACADYVSRHDGIMRAISRCE